MNNEFRIRRRPINEETAAEVRYSVDMRCCLCEPINGVPPRTRNGQIHHLDEDPGNNELANLVWLCLEHHEDVGKTGKVSRRISSATLTKYRDLLQRKVQRIREHPDPRPRAARRAFLEAFDAQVVLEIKKLQYRVGNDHNWERIAPILYEVSIYPDTVGFEAKEAILELLYDLASSARYRMPSHIAHTIAHFATDHTDMWYLRNAAKRRVSKDSVNLVRYGAEIGFCLAYDGIRYLDDLQVAEQGCELLWRYLSFGLIRGSREIQTIARQHFVQLVETAQRAENPLATLLVTTCGPTTMSGRRLPPFCGLANVKICSHMLRPGTWGLAVRRCPRLHQRPRLL